jgi:hypothetical protein
MTGQMKWAVYGGVMLVAGNCAAPRNAPAKRMKLGPLSGHFVLPNHLQQKAGAFT